MVGPNVGKRAAEQGRNAKPKKKKPNEPAPWKAGLRPARLHKSVYRALSVTVDEVVAHPPWVYKGSVPPPSFALTEYTTQESMSNLLILSIRSALPSFEAPRGDEGASTQAAAAQRTGPGFLDPNHLSKEIAELRSQEQGTGFVLVAWAPGSEASKGSPVVAGFLVGVASKKENGKEALVVAVGGLRWRVPSSTPGGDAKASVGGLLLAAAVDRWQREKFTAVYLVASDEETALIYDEGYGFEKSDKRFGTDGKKKWTIARGTEAVFPGFSLVGGVPMRARLTPDEAHPEPVVWGEIVERKAGALVSLRVVDT